MSSIQSQTPAILRREGCPKHGDGSPRFQTVGGFLLVNPIELPLAPSQRIALTGTFAALTEEDSFEAARVRRLDRLWEISFASGEDLRFVGKVVRMNPVDRVCRTIQRYHITLFIKENAS